MHLNPLLPKDLLKCKSPLRYWKMFLLEQNQELMFHPVRLVSRLPQTVYIHIQYDHIAGSHSVIFIQTSDL